MGLYYRRDVMIPSHRSWRRLFDGGCTSWWWLFFKFYSRTGLEENRIQTMHIQSSGSQTSRNVSANEYKKCKFYLQTIHTEHKWVIFKSLLAMFVINWESLLFPYSRKGSEDTEDRKDMEEGKNCYVLVELIQVRITRPIRMWRKHCGAIN